MENQVKFKVVLFGKFYGQKRFESQAPSCLIGILWNHRLLSTAIYFFLSTSI